MPDITIRLRPNGPLVVEGPFKLIDSRGAEFEIPANKPAVALCRCGQSAKHHSATVPTNPAASSPTKRRQLWVEIEFSINRYANRSDATRVSAVRATKPTNANVAPAD